MELMKLMLWYYAGLGNLGGWIVFLLLGLIPAVWMLYNSQVRQLPAAGWKLGAALSLALLVPTVLYRFAGGEVQQSLVEFVELFFYLGVLGGILPLVIAVGYALTFADAVNLGETDPGPVPAAGPQVVIVQQPGPRYAPAAPGPSSSTPSAPTPSSWAAAPAPAPLPPAKAKVQAWLVGSDGRNYQLNCGETSLGRSASNDVQITADRTVSGAHAKIIESQHHFRLYDLASTNGTRLNGQIVREGVQLQANDEIQLGDHTVLRFVAGQG